MSTAVVVLGIGAGVVIIILVMVGGLFLLTLNRDTTRQRVQQLAFTQEATTVQRNQDTRRRAQLNRWRLRFNNMLSMLTSEKLALQLISANWPITETEYFVIRFASIFVGLIIGGVAFRSIYSGVGVAVIAYILPGFFLQRSILNRRNKFEGQLIDVLVLMTGAVRAGYSILQALDVIIDEMNAPASDEFRRVRREVGLGLPLSQALTNLTTRMENDDLLLVVTAIKINQQVGGNMATMLEAVTKTIRERVALFAEIRALTSQQRYASYALTLLPFLVAALLFILNPEYIARVFEPGPFLCIPFGALILVLIGNVWIRSLTKIDV